MAAVPDIKSRRCTLCGGCLFHPFFYWFGWRQAPDEKAELHICSACCVDLRSPQVTADLIHINAIVEWQAARRTNKATLQVNGVQTIIDEQRRQMREQGGDLGEVANDEKDA
jgi:hypothetical protein